MDLERYIKNRRDRINSALARYLPSAKQIPKNLHTAMRYVVLNGGKRLRPILLYATGEIYGAKTGALDVAACAIELVHAFSLVHDDLPAMDDDELRRGKPTCHIAFDEATAILVGDALLALAFEILSKSRMPKISDQIRLQIVQVLAVAMNSQKGLAGGQDLDMQNTGKILTPKQLENIYVRKTGALIAASFELGALSAGITNAVELTALHRFGILLGVAFQIQDDVLDVESTARKLGKNTQHDLECGKITYPHLLGVMAAKTRAKKLYQQALSEITRLNVDTELLQQLAAKILSVTINNGHHA